MTNEYIEVVKKWQAGEEVSGEQLRANADAAWKVYVDAEAAAEAADDWAFVVRHDHSNRVAHAAKDDAHALWAAYDDAAVADKWVKRYEELTNDKSTKRNETEA